VDPEHATVIFRIFQETLTNVVRHASATHVTANLIGRAGEIVLKVKDNGKGIEKERISHPQSFGLMGMRERALILGGRLEIDGIPGEGTTITVNIPLERKDEK
jgi:signal transduction histidine kinase